MHVKKCGFCTLLRHLNNYKCRGMWEVIFVAKTDKYNLTTFYKVFIGMRRRISHKIDSTKSKVLSEFDAYANVMN